MSERDLRVPVTLPPAGTAEPYPLVIGLHSLFHDSSESRSQWGLEQLSAIAGFAVAYPDGEGLSWNAGTCCESAAATGVDDVGWLRSLISHL
nr:hypothetical protein [Micromonospora sp. DSM 115978]